ncbi:MAG: orotate phosphoribosyltransferase [Candidatus Thermoplasmatota archaeon]|jgi:orotate phosphoribosyltransferase|nr:orotate phosphoribosyltransferase [Candidatus Thermoplasmatota archaeon]MCL5786303.1 orotate phosphoribosyltransferase [Candidatus Thermoplasmatota archaeon]
MLADDLVNEGAIKKGKFILTSGKESTFYVDLKEFNTNTGNLSRVADEISRMMKEEAAAGVELGAVPILVAVALKKNIPYSIIRKERQHGNVSLLIGNHVSGKKVAIVEDVVTTGGSVLRAAALLRDHGAIVENVYCVVDREEGGEALLLENGIKLHSLVRISSVVH